MQKNEPVSWCIVHCLVFWYLWEGRVFAVIRSKWHRIRDQGRSSLHIRACTALARQCFDARTHACMKHTHSRSVKHSNTHTNIQTNTQKHTRTETRKHTRVGLLKLLRMTRKKVKWQGLSPWGDTCMFIKCTELCFRLSHWKDFHISIFFNTV